MLVHLVAQLRSPKLFSRCEISWKIKILYYKFFFVDHCESLTELDFSTLNWVADSDEIR